MDVELNLKCTEVEDALYSAQVRILMKYRLLWGASYAVRNTDVAHMPDQHVEILAELAYLSTLPAYCFITTPSCEATLRSMSPDYRTYFKHIVALAHQLDTYSQRDLATDSDWEAWMDSM